jgi:hypothetical protein
MIIHRSVVVRATKQWCPKPKEENTLESILPIVIVIIIISIIVVVVLFFRGSSVVCRTQESL